MEFRRLCPNSHSGRVCEPNNPPPSSAKINNARTCISTLPYMSSRRGAVFTTGIWLNLEPSHGKYNNNRSRVKSLKSQRVRRQISPTYTTYNCKAACGTSGFFLWSSAPIAFTNHTWMGLRPKHSAHTRLTVQPACRRPTTVHTCFFF